MFNHIQNNINVNNIGGMIHAKKDMNMYFDNF